MTPESPIVQQRVCSLAGQNNRNFLWEFDEVKETYEFNLKRYDKKEVFGDHFKRYNENRLIEHCLILIKTATAMQEPATAKEIQKRALALLDDARLKSALS